LRLPASRKKELRELRGLTGSRVLQSQDPLRPTGDVAQCHCDESAFRADRGRSRYSNRLIDYLPSFLCKCVAKPNYKKRFLITRGLRIGNGENELVTMVTNRVVFPVTYENVRSRYPHVNGRCCPRSVPRRTGNTSRPLRDHGHSGHRSGILPVVSKTTGRMTCEKVSLCRSGG
jgi:hypothetical protein